MREFSLIGLCGVGWLTRCMGTHGETASVLDPQSSTEAGAAFWLLGGKEASRIYWQRGKARGSQPQPRVLSNLIPRANPKQLPTEHAIWNSIMHSWQQAMASNPQNCRRLAYLKATHIFSSALCLSSYMLLMHLKNCNKFGLGRSLVKENNTKLDTQMTYWDL